MGKTIGVVLALKDKCSPQLSKVAEKMGITEKEAKKLHTQAKKLSKELGEGIKKASVVCTAAIGAVALATQQLVNRTIEAGDNVDKMSQKIGMSRKAYQEWDYIMSQNGSNVDVLQMGYKKLASQMDGVKKGSKESVKLFRQLGVSVKNNRGQLRGQEDVFNDTIRALQRMKNPTEKAIMANKLFGKSAIELKPLLNQSADSVDGLRKKANDLGMVMSDEAIDASVKMKDTFDTIQRSMNGLGLYVGSKFLPVIQTFADKFTENIPKIKATVTPIFDSLVGVFKFLSENMELVISIASGLVSTFASFNIITGVIKTISTLQKAIEFVTAAQGIWNAVMLMNPIGAIAVAIGLLVAGVVFAYKKFEGFRNCVQAVWACVKLLGTVIVTVSKAVWDKIGPFVKFGATLLSWITPIGLVIRGLTALCKWVGKAVQLAGGLRGIGDKVKNWADDKRANLEAKNSEKPKKHALGTSYSTGGPAIVGEYGPELINLKKGDSVTPAPKTQQILNNNKDIKLELHIHGNIFGIDDFVEQVKTKLALELSTALATV